jgi:hypothetical protein
MAPLSTIPVGEWWDQLSPIDKTKARRLFQSMQSGSGFVNDLRQGRPGGTTIDALHLRESRVRHW